MDISIRCKEKKLFECTYSIKEVSPEKYAYIDNYGLKNYNGIIIGSHFYWIIDNEFIEVPSLEIIQTQMMTCYRTNSSIDNNTYVYYMDTDGKTRLLGRSCEEISEDLYKIGNQIYQLKKGNLEFLQTCHQWEMWRDVLEVHTGEPGASDFFAYKKSGSEWVQKYHTRSTVMV